MLLYLILFLALNAMYASAYVVNFNQNVTGAVLTPYTKNESHTLQTDYTLEEIRLMLKVISTKFSKIYTSSTGALPNATYEQNVTYYKSKSVSYCGEAAAMVNRETAVGKSTGNILNMNIGIWIYTEPNRMHAEVQLALESVHKSNAIFPGTCTGLVLFAINADTNLDLANLMLNHLKQLKSQADQLNLRLGTRQECDGFTLLANTPVDMLDSVGKALRATLLLSNFVICNNDYDLKNSEAPYKTFDKFSKGILEYRNAAWQINPNIEVMIIAGITSGDSTYNPLKNFHDYWLLMDEFGTNNNISVFMDEAIDNPYKQKFSSEFSHLGWWSLKNDNLSLDENGYKEKVAPMLNTPGFSNVRKSEETAEISVWTYIGSIVGPLMALVLLVMLVGLWIRFNKLQDLLSKKEISNFLYGDSSENIERGENGPLEPEAHKKPYDKSIEIAKDDFEIRKEVMLGSGAFGFVYKAEMKIGSISKVVEVALKMTKDNCPKTAVMSLLSEIKILSYLGKHEYLVCIQGAYTAEMAKGIVYVATELCGMGSLKDYLRNAHFGSSKQKNGNDYQNACSSKSISFRDMVQWAYEIACGMEYLAEKHVVHADLAARNVLLTEDKKAKISDFGLSRRLYDYTNYVKKQQEPLPWRWMSIEALKKLEFSSKSDVWSYGVTLWEIFSMGDVPFPGLSWTMDFVSKLENGLRMNSPSYANDDIYNQMIRCWDKEPQDRPTFPELKELFAGFTETNKKE